ncbi:hypothetical protein [Mycoplasma hafezii]|uniref:hypothetical protein n=1 Tax=Mycoplasma hafezii TaxID=525886 RepID=UPI003CEB21EF
MKYIQKEHKSLKGVFKWSIGDFVYISKTNAKSGFTSRFNSIFTAIKQYLQDLSKPRVTFEELLMSNEYSSKYLYTKIVFALLQQNDDPKALLENFKDYIDIEILDSSADVYDDKKLQDIELKFILAEQPYIYGLNQNETAQLFFDRSVNRKYDYKDIEKEKLNAGLVEFEETFDQYLLDLDWALENRKRLPLDKEFLIKYNSLNSIIAFDELYFFDYVFYEKWPNYEEIKQRHWDIKEKNDLIKTKIQDYNSLFKIKSFI